EMSTQSLPRVGFKTGRSTDLSPAVNTIWSDTNALLFTDVRARGPATAARVRAATQQLSHRRFGRRPGLWSCAGERRVAGKFAPPAAHGEAEMPTAALRRPSMERVRPEAERLTWRSDA